MNTLLIVGAGYVGERLAFDALSRDFNVVVTTRSPEKLEALSSAGAHVVRWDILNDEPEQLAKWLTPDCTLIYSVPTLFKDYSDAKPHITPVANLLNAAQNIGHLIYLSSTSVYGDHQGQRVTEESVCRPTSDVGKMRLDLEQLFMSIQGPNVSVARLVGIYGPGRTLYDYLKRGRYKLVNGGHKKANRVHVDDIIQALWAMIHRDDQTPRRFNVCDGQPLSVRELVSFLVEHTDLTWPEDVTLEAYAKTRPQSVVDRWRNTYLCDGGRMHDALGVRLKYPTVLDGYQSLLADGYFSA